MRLVPEEEIREQVASVFQRGRTRLEALVPDARIEHVGSTTVAGSLTKGDLDICVIIDADHFDPAVQALSEAYDVHQPENWTAALASFIAPPEEGIEVGIQRVVAGTTEEDSFIGWRERLRADPELRARYDRVKEEHVNGPIEEYRAAKERLILEG
jgi:GrpB-like predicted nucleotidyltransferase (UPF0157 family)